MCPATETSWDESRAVRRPPAHSSRTSRGALDAGWPLADQHAPPAVDPGRQASLLPRVRRDGASGHRRLEARLRRADDPAAAPARVRAVVAGGHRVSWLGPGGPRVLRAARRLGPPTPARVRRRRELRLSRDPLPGARRPRRRLRAEPGLPRVLRGVVRGEQRSEEHTSELQSLTNLVCRLLL